MIDYGLEIPEGHIERLADSGTTEQVHVFDQVSIDAVNAAMAAGRPLLVRGEPGTGKSQLAYAAASALRRPCLCQVIDSRTSAQDLLWTFDAVARLAEAQLAGALGLHDKEVMKDRLLERRFVTPGPLWWALDWDSAEAQAELVSGAFPMVGAGCTPKNGTVMLIDEIDKADSDVPNGLLEVLGHGTFRPRGFDSDFSAKGRTALVVITTNEERALPDAFVRRCLVLHILLPLKTDELEALLLRRGRAHFPKVADAVLKEAACQLVKDREDLKARRLPAPGQAEYLDLVRAVTNLKSSEIEQLDLLRTIARFVLQKQPEEVVG